MPGGSMNDHGRGRRRAAAARYRYRPGAYRLAGAILALVSISGCGALGLAPSVPDPPPPAEKASIPVTPEPEAQVAARATDHDRDTYRTINRYRAAKLARDARRLQDALERAEQALTADGSSVGYTSADAISALAEAQVQVQGEAAQVPWRRREFSQVKEHLATAKRHIDERNYSAAMYFVYRANQTMEEIREEARLVRGNPAVLYVKGKRVNMRAGPSTDEPVITVIPRNDPVLLEQKSELWRLVRTPGGYLGWIYAPLLVTKPVPE